MQYTLRCNANSYILVLKVINIGALMAIQFARIEIVKRNSGGRACLKGAYNARIRVKDEKYNRHFDFRKRQDSVYHEVLLADCADRKYKSVAQLMNLVERSETRKDSQLLKDIVIALPDDKEITLKDRIEITKRIIDRAGYVKEGLAVQMDIHSPHNGEYNWHAHLLVTTRRFREDGLNLEDKKARDLNPEFYSSDGKSFAIPENRIIGSISRDVQNEYFSEKDLTLRVDPTANIGSIHIGPKRMRSPENKNIDHNEEIHDANLEVLRTGDDVLNRITSIRSVFTEYEIKRAVKNMIDKEVRESLIKDAMSSSRVLPLFLDDETTANLFTTIEVRVDEERVMTQAALNAKVGGYDLNITDRNGLSPQQIQALEYLVNKKRGGLRILKGRAGSGKSTVLSKLIDKGVVALSPTHKAAIELKNKGFKQSYTIDSFLWKARSNRIDLGDIKTVIVDEAGMVSTPTYREIFKLTENMKMQVILSGDERQLSSISRGGMFEVLADRFKSFELSEVHRQKIHEDRRVSEFMAKSDVKEALQLIKDRVHFTKGEHFSTQKLISYWEDSEFDIKDRLIVTISNKDVDKLNKLAREALRHEGRLGKESWQIGYKDIPFAENDRVVFTKTNKSIGVYNSEFGSIIGFETSSDVSKLEKVVVKIDNGREINFNPNYYHYIKHGYASTVYKSQGASIKDVYVLHSGFSTMNNSYVKMTRHVDNLNIYVNSKVTPNMKALCAQLSKVSNTQASLAYATENDLGRDKTFLHSIYYKYKMAFIRISDDESYYSFKEDKLDRRDVFKIAKIGRLEERGIDKSKYVDFARIKRDASFAAERIAFDILGRPNENYSNGSSLRYGEHGRLIVTTTGPKAGLWYDHSSGRGGDMLSFVSENKNLDIRQSAIYIKDLVREAKLTQKRYEEYEKGLASKANYSKSASLLKNNNTLEKSLRSVNLYNRSEKICSNTNLYKDIDSNIHGEANSSLRKLLSTKILDTQHKEKIDRELHVIEKHNYAKDFLLACDIKDFCKANDISCVLRGSANSSYAAKELGLHNHDIDRHGLMPERFLSSDNKPDFDFDIDSRYRDLVEGYILSKHGGSRLQMDDGRAHVCSIGIGGEIKNGMTKQSEYKFDLLSSVHLAKIKSMADEVGIKSIAKDDIKTFDMLSRGETAGIFQLSKAGRECKILEPKSMEDLINLSAAIRPGAKAQIDILVGKIKSDLPDPAGVFKNTRGAILFQEQIMRAGKEYFKVKNPNEFRKDLGIISKLQESLGSKTGKEQKIEIRNEINNRKSQILENATIKNADKLLEQMIGSYVFNKAHAVAYANEIYKSAYIKANHKEVWLKFNSMRVKDLRQNINPERAKIYLSNYRGINTDIGSDIRVADMKLEDIKYPALLCFARNEKHEITGHQAIYLNPYNLEKETKKSYGSIKGSFVDVAKSDALGQKTTIIAEGIETALSIKEAGIGANIKCSLGISNIMNYKPEKNEHLILAVDNDGENSRTYQLATKAAEKYREMGARVDITMPEEEGKDYNDLLRENKLETIKNDFSKLVEYVDLADYLSNYTNIDIDIRNALTTNFKYITKESGAKLLYTLNLMQKGLDKESIMNVIQNNPKGEIVQRLEIEATYCLFKEVHYNIKERSYADEGFCNRSEYLSHIFRDKYNAEMLEGTEIGDYYEREKKFAIEFAESLKREDNIKGALADWRNNCFGLATCVYDEIHRNAFENLKDTHTEIIANNVAHQIAEHAMIHEKGEDWTPDEHIMQDFMDTAHKYEHHTQHLHEITDCDRTSEVMEREIRFDHYLHDDIGIEERHEQIQQGYNQKQLQMQDHLTLEL